MKPFKDANNRNWELKITIGAAERVKAYFHRDGEREIDLLKLDEGKPPLVAVLDADPALLCHVIFVLLKPQAETAQVDEDKFCEYIDGPTWKSASQVFWEELKDFFRSLRRDDLIAVIDTQHRLLKTVVSRQTDKVLNLNLEALIEKAETTSATRGTPSGDSPESSGSTPDR